MNSRKLFFPIKLKGTFKKDKKIIIKYFKFTCLCSQANLINSFSKRYSPGFQIDSPGFCGRFSPSAIGHPTVNDKLSDMFIHQFNPFPLFFLQFFRRKRWVFSGVKISDSFSSKFHAIVCCVGLKVSRSIRGS
jgi:hypothetical protein